MMSNIWIPHSYEIYVKPSEQDMSQRKLQNLKKYCEILQWGRRNPDKFIYEFVGFELLDIQKYILMNSWTTPQNIWLESRGSGKSVMIAIFIMAKSLLFNNYESYIASGSSDQAISTFIKLENLAMDAIESATDLTKSFMDELKVSNSSGNGFVHNPMGYTFTLWNGSKCTSLNSNIDKKRGKRANLVVFDETGFLPEEMLNVYAAFTAVSKGFKLGRNIDVRTLPLSVPNQLIYASSASSDDTPYYKKVLDFTKKYIAGDPNYFICDINCDAMINATYNGEKHATPLLSQETVDAEMRQNSEKAKREYYNIFTSSVGSDQIISRASIMKNSKTYPPVLYNDTNTRKFVFAYDPARSYDNSILSIGELKYDETKGYTMDIVNCVNFVDTKLKKKTPMITPEQIKHIKNLLVDYNGDALDYENIECFMIDAGSGGGGNKMPEEFWDSFRDRRGNTHRGLIDEIYSKEYLTRYPEASKGTIRFLEPSAYKSDMFESLIKMIEADLITFPEQYDNRGHLIMTTYDNNLMAKTEQSIRTELNKRDLSIDEYESLLNKALSSVEGAKTTMYKLSHQEENALVNINLMKEEIVNICRIKGDGNKDRFKLPAHKDSSVSESENTMHDDRAYTLAMLGWFLSEKRLEKQRNRKRPRKETKKVGYVRPPRKVTIY
nr:MAG TPA: Terminase large subunit [Caudoviricetes sp.]